MTGLDSAWCPGRRRWSAISAARSLGSRAPVGSSGHLRDRAGLALGEGAPVYSRISWGKLNVCADTCYQSDLEPYRFVLIGFAARWSMLTGLLLDRRVCEFTCFSAPHYPTPRQPHFCC